MGNQNSLLDTERSDEFNSNKQKSQHYYKKRWNSLFSFSSSWTPAMPANSQQQTEENYLYNLFKNYTHKQLQSLYFEYEYLELIKETFYINFNLPRVPITENVNALDQHRCYQTVKFHFIKKPESSSPNEFIRIDAHTLFNASSYFKRLCLTHKESTRSTIEHQEYTLCLNSSIITYNEMYFMKKFLCTNKINFELFFSSVQPPAVDTNSFTLHTTQHATNTSSSNASINEINVLKLLEFYYKSCFFEIDSLNVYIENYILNLVDEQLRDQLVLNVKIFILLLNSTSVTKHTEYLYERLLNKFVLKFNKLFFDDSKTSRLSLKKCKFNVNSNHKNLVEPCDLLNNLNKNVLIDVLKSSYLNINELNLFKLCLRWSKNKIEQDKINERRCQNDDEMQYLLSTSGTKTSPTKKLRNFFRLSTNSSFKLVKMKRNFSKILNKQKFSDDFLVYNDHNVFGNDDEDQSDCKKLSYLLNELVKYLNLSFLINELNYLTESVSIEPESQYYHQEYNYLINVINGLSAKAEFQNYDAVASVEGNSNPPDFILNNSKLKQSCCRLTKPMRLNAYLIDKLHKYLSLSVFDKNYDQQMNLPDMVNSTLTSRNDDDDDESYTEVHENKVEKKGSLSSINQFSFSKNDFEISKKLKERLNELKGFHDFLYKHKKCDKHFLDKFLKLIALREFGFNLNYNENFFEYMCKKLDFLLKNN